MPERIHPGMPEWEKFGYEHVQRYEFAVTLAQNRRVLDAACVTGYGAEMLATQGTGEEVGVDADAGAIECLASRMALGEASWACRLEDRLRRLLGRPSLQYQPLFEPVAERTRNVPLLEHRRAVCMQIVLLLQKKEPGQAT